MTVVNESDMFYRSDGFDKSERIDKSDQINICVINEKSQLLSCSDALDIDEVVSLKNE